LATSAGIAPKRTALNLAHRQAGARMVDFAGWEMPVEYSGIVDEHLAVRTRAGLFDVSHMGEIDVRGPRALELLQFLTPNDVSRLQVFQAQYSALMYPEGSAVDDCVIHRLGPDHFFICVNAANTENDFQYILSRNPFQNSSEVDVQDVSAQYSQLALQGPAAVEIMKKVSDGDVEALKTYWFSPMTCCGVEGILARTGYTGEDGFEFYFAPAESEKVWNTLLGEGKSSGVAPAGLGARNTLRLEAAYALYGNELDRETTLLEANLGWICKLDKGEFLGRGLLADQKLHGLRKKLVGFEMEERGIARDHYPVRIEGRQQGHVTSGSYAPYLRKNIGLAYIPPEHAEPGREFDVEIRGKSVRARQTTLPFYRKSRDKKQTA
jgi:aminomethyltransferase